ncbi:MAG TPA: hypothetical protein VJK25_03915 [Patescibacteria group bacterium]|nr:hypothetical protein [Patescibacteria group bacterium]
MDYGKGSNSQNGQTEKPDYLFQLDLVFDGIEENHEKEQWLYEIGFPDAGRGYLVG